MPNQSTYKSYMRGLKRLRCKDRGAFKHMDQKIDIVSIVINIAKLKIRYK